MKLLDQFKNDAFLFIENAKLNQIVKLIRDANKVYYNSGNPIMTDEEYDLLKDELKKREPSHKLLSQVGEKVHSKNKVTLPYFMGSMDKIKPGNGLINKWISKYNGPYIASDKLDGTSALLLTTENQLYTRGDGTTGTNITSILGAINGIPDVEDYVIRGELLISKKKFKKFGSKFANSRALVNGLVNKKNVSGDELNIIDFVAYEIIEPEMKFSKQFSILKKLGFIVSYNKKIKTINENSLSEYFKMRRNKGEYDIDGIILTDGDNHERNTSGNPKYSFAFKDILEDQIANAVIDKVEWRISKDGLIKPRVHIEPISIGGITITHVTGHNAKYIIKSGIGKGAKIKLIRSGDVIPYILDITKKVEPSYPNFPYKWNKSGVDLMVDESKSGDDEKKALLIKNLTYFFKKMKIKNVDHAIITKFIDNELNSINKILNASIDDFLQIEGFKIKMATKIYNNIRSSIENVNLSIVMAASNIFGAGLGAKKLEIIIQNYPNIMKMKSKNLLKNIISLDGFNTLTATNFVEHFDEFKLFIKENSMIKYKINKIKKGKFNDINIVITGFRDKNLEKFIIDNGGNIRSSISGTTNFIITNDKNSNSSKIMKACQLKIPIMLKHEFMSKYDLSIIV